MSNFHVGQKVVCIQGAEGQKTRAKGTFRPITGAIYTVRGVYNGPIRVDLHLEEYVHDEFHDNGVEYGWDASRFRPVDKRKTSIEIFKAMLTPSKERVSA
jgi:hypothetical protein